MLFVGFFSAASDYYNILKSKKEKGMKLKEQQENQKKEEEKKRVKQEEKGKFDKEQEEKGLVKFIDKTGEEHWGKPKEIEELKEIDSGLRDNFTSMNHFEFEEFIGELFKKMGYEVKVTKKTGDYGIDVVATKGEEIIAIQVKKYAAGHHVGAPDVQNTLGSMHKYKATKAIIITTSNFTVQAEEQAKEAPIELWNKRILHDMVIKYFIKGK